MKKNLLKQNDASKRKRTITNSGRSSKTPKHLLSTSEKEPSRRKTKKPVSSPAKDRENLCALSCKIQAKKVELGDKATSNNNTRPSRKFEESRQIPSKTTESSLKKTLHRQL